MSDIGRGEDISGSSPFAGMSLTIPSDQVQSVSMRPLEPLVGSMPPSAPPTAYEVRRDALMAAAAYCNGGGYGGASGVTGMARDFERFLSEVKNK